MKNDHRSKFSNLSNWKEEAWKNQSFNGIRTRGLREYRCDVLPTELWSHTLGARSIYWVHESEEWSSQWIFQFKQLELRRSLKKSELQRYQYELFHIYFTSFHSSRKIWTHWPRSQCFNCWLAVQNEVMVHIFCGAHILCLAKWEAWCKLGMLERIQYTRSQMF